jgi:hypothetical protein
VSLPSCRNSTWLIHLRCHSSWRKCSPNLPPSLCVKDVCKLPLKSSMCYRYKQRLCLSLLTDNWPQDSLNTPKSMKKIKLSWFSFSYSPLISYFSVLCKNNQRILGAVTISICFSFTFFQSPCIALLQMAGLKFWLLLGWALGHCVNFDDLSLP